MATTRRRKAPPSAEHPSVAMSARQPSQTLMGHSPKVGVREWTLRLALMLGAPLLFFGLIEGVLRLVHYGNPTVFFMRTPDGKAYTANPKFACQFYSEATATQPFPFLMPVHKAPQTKRLFVLGESAAAGTPDPAFGFARILEVLLREQYPATHFEVINGAMRGINSHIVRRIARECAGFEPDCFVVYMGNNETVGLYGPEPGKFNVAAHPRWLRVVEFAKTTKLGQLAQATGRKLSSRTEPSPEQDMAFFRARRVAVDDPLRIPVYHNFRSNLEDIGNAARRAGAKVVLSTVGVNLRDFPPLASLHRRGLTGVERTQWENAVGAGLAAQSSNAFPQAIESYALAQRIDGHHADLRFRLGQCFAARTLWPEAQEQFSAARDWDALQFRTDTTLNRIIRETGSQPSGSGFHLVDMEKAVTQNDSSAGRMPGAELFLDHVHFTFSGDYLAARTLLPAVTAALGLGESSTPVPTRQQCADALAFTDWDEINVDAAMARMTANPPFLDQMDHAARQLRAEQSVTNRLSRFTKKELTRVVGVYRQAIARNPNDWLLHKNLGNLFSDAGDHAAAATELELAVQAVPHFLPLRLSLAAELLECGQPEKSRHQLEAAHQLDPGAASVKEALARPGVH